MKEKIASILTWIFNFIIALPSLLMDTFLWIIFAYGLIALNILVITGSDPLTTFGTTIQRLDILNSILTTTFCLIVSFIYSMYIKKGNKRQYLFAYAIVCIMVTFTLSQLILQTELHDSFFNLSYIRYGTIVTFISVVLLALVSKYDERSDEKAASLQKFADKSRDIEEVNVNGESWTV